MKNENTTWVDLYRKMLTIRRFEERVSILYREGEIPGFVHLYIGEEAIAVGVCSQLNKDDFITSTHRGHGHLIAKGGDLKLMMAELYGKGTGYCKGKGGSMHIADMELGILGANGIVGGGLPIAVGAGYSARLRKTSQVSVAFFGDGASNEGIFHESLNMASAWDLPVIFVCENNQFGVSTRLCRICKNEDLAQRASGYGIPGVCINGNDVLEVTETIREAVERARNGLGPTFVVASTFRQHGHFEGEKVTYWTEDELENWKQNDPLLAMKIRLLGESLASEKDFSKWEAEITHYLDEATKFARESAYPEPSEALDDLFFEEGGKSR